MSRHDELQKAAAYAAQDTIKFSDEDEEMRALQQFHEEVDPETVLALIAENEQLAKTADCWDRLNVNNKALSDSFRAERDQSEQDYKDVVGTIELRDIEIAKLRAEVAGLKTGYEAYERVNAELKAEVERLERNRDMWKGQVERQAEELAALRKAAERYEWLRRRDLETVHAGGVFAGRTPHNVVLNGVDLDIAIDAAMGKGEQS